MFSYLDKVKELVPHEIYQLGVREYLLGNVLEYISMDLKDWRSYEVKGREVYTVTMPLLHFLTTKLQWSRGGENLKRLSSCTCEYYDTIGACKHIIAVCASLDHEFKTSSELNPVTTPTLSKILDFQTNSEARQWFHDFEYYLELTTEDDPQNLSIRRIYETIRASFASPHQQFQNNLVSYINQNLGNDEFEKRLLQLVLYTKAWLVGGYEWWKVFLPIIEHLESQKKIHFWADFWMEFEFFETSIYESVLLIQEAARELDMSEKTSILTALREKKALLPTQLSFAQFACETNFLLTNLGQMDAGGLIRLLPDMREYTQDIEFYISQQMQTVSDYLNSNNESNLIQYLELWNTSNPDSGILRETVSTIRSQHSRRKRLLSQLKKFG